jgi:fructose-1,6-bisphosphatase/inositol monophosphatase family enzyme
MVLNTNDLNLLSQCAISAALQAGRTIQKHSKNQVEIRYKTGGTSLASQVVTEIDQLSQDIILQALAPSCHAYDLGLLTEESEDDLSRLEKDYFWCIDPLDGTLPFTESIPGYSVSIALVSRDGEPKIGVIYDPVENNLYHAVKNAGVNLNGQEWIPNATLSTSKKYFTLISDRSFEEHKSYDKILEELQIFTRNMGFDSIKTICQGGAAMNACWVLENAPSCYFKFPKISSGGGSLWDYAATACIFSETGAVARDIRGNALDLNRQESTFMNHHGILYASNNEIAKAIMELYQKIIL